MYETKTQLKILEQRGEALRQQFQNVRLEPVIQEVEGFQVVEGSISVEQRLRHMYAQANRAETWSLMGIRLYFS